MEAGRRFPSRTFNSEYRNLSNTFINLPKDSSLHNPFSLTTSLFGIPKFTVNRSFTHLLIPLFYLNLLHTPKLILSTFTTVLKPHPGMLSLRSTPIITNRPYNIITDNCRSIPLHRIPENLCFFRDPWFTTSLPIATT